MSLWCVSIYFPLNPSPAAPEQVTPELIGFLLVKRQADGELLWDGDTPLRQASLDFKELNLGLIFERLPWGSQPISKPLQPI